MKRVYKYCIVIVVLCCLVGTITFNLREKENLAYSVGTDFDSVGNCGEFLCYILTTTDNVTFYESGYLNYSFGASVTVSTSFGYSGPVSYYPDPYDYNDLARTYCAIWVDHGASVGKLKFDTNYRLLCMDVDGPDGPIKPFGYGIRRDGKIATGLRADWWLEREITKKEPDCCPLSAAQYNASGNTVNLCDTGDTLCP